MSKSEKMMIVVVAVVAFIGIAIFGYYMLGDSKIDPVLKSVSELDPIRNNSKDNLGMIGIESLSDVGYYFEDKDSVTIKYGKHTFKVQRKYLRDEEVESYLTKLHLSIKTNEKGSLVIYYNGKKVSKMAT